MRNNLMKKMFIGWLVAGVLGATTAFGANNMEKMPMKIKVSFNHQEVIVRMQDNTAVRQFLQMLPAEFNFTDFAGEEKISQFPQPISLTNVPRGMIAEKGKMFIYAPWGNFGFFYKTHGKTVDTSLIELGEVESGIDHLSNMKTDFSARIEICENNPTQ